jgi:hypothetical protein
MPCEKCAKGHKAHSFENLGTLQNGVNVFYTCPARRDDFDDDNFLEDFGQHLQETNQKPWIWIFDCNNYEAKHMLGLKDSLGLLRLFETIYKDSLQAMYVVNEAWYFHLFLKTVKPFMKAETRSKLQQISGSPLQAAAELDRRGIPFTLSQRIREPIQPKI